MVLRCPLVPPPMIIIANKIGLVFFGVTSSADFNLTSNDTKSKDKLLSEVKQKCWFSHDLVKDITWKLTSATEVTSMRRG